MVDKEYYKELKTMKDVLDTLPLHVRDDELIRENAKFMFNSIKEIKKDGRDAKIYLVKFFCPFCKCYDTMHTIALQNVNTVFKGKFEKDEPLSMMCQKCMERARILYESGITDQGLVKEILEDMGEEDRQSVNVAM